MSGSSDKSMDHLGIDPGRAAEMRVLVVDDDFQLIDCLKQFFEELKFQVVTALSGDEALEAIVNGGEIDIALIDYRLPGIDGLETIKKILGFYPDTVCIVITGLPTLDSSIRAIRLGASDYLLKPFNLEDVASAMKKAMKEREIKLEIRNLRERVESFQGNNQTRAKININDDIGRIQNARDLPPAENRRQRP
jgi:DNA-binding NtrC family response regulator